MPFCVWMIHRSAISGLKKIFWKSPCTQTGVKRSEKAAKEKLKELQKAWRTEKKPSSGFLVNIKLKGARLLHSTAYTVQWYYCVHFPGSQFSQGLRVIWNHWSIEKSNMFFLCLNVGTKWSASFDLHQVGNILHSLTFLSEFKIIAPNCITQAVKMPLVK